MSAIALAGWVIAGTSSAYVLAWGAWWTLLSAVALPKPRGRGRGPSALPRMVVLVPAYNEAPTIGTCIEALQAAGAGGVASPEIVVIADNCSDETASVARERGATVLERHDLARRGKGHALEYALASLGARAAPPEVVAFVDADTRVSAEFFAAIAAELASGAQAVQVHYEAAAGGSTLTQLRRLAFFLVHWSRPLGVRRLGLGSGIKGTGMAFRWEIAPAGLGSAGITEDAAMTLALAERGVNVRFSPYATVRGEMAATYESARTQDERWEGGRRRLMGTALGSAVRAARRGRIDCAAQALEVAAPPLSLLGVIAAANLVAAALWRGPVAPLQVAATASLMSYVAIGLAASPATLRDLGALRGAPRFALHKLSVLARVATGRADATWRRTERGAPPAPPRT